MFPTPIEKTSQTTQWLYTFALPVALIIWLLPLLGVAITSVRPASDLAQGNYFGMPSTFAWNNYVDIFLNTPLWKYIRNSFIVTIPTVIGTVALSCMAGFCAGGLQIQVEPAAVLHVRRRQFRAVPDPDGAGARPHIADRSLQHLCRPHPVPHRFPDRLLHPLHAQLHQRPAVRID